MNLRQYARSKPCMVRIGGVCNHNPETTVLAHLPGAGLGIKSHDLQAAWCCSDCHDVVDYRRLDLDLGTMEIRLYHLEGIHRTQQELLKAGLGEVIDEWAKSLKL